MCQMTLNEIFLSFVDLVEDRPRVSDDGAPRDEADTPGYQAIVSVATPHIVRQTTCSLADASDLVETA